MGSGRWSVSTYNDRAVLRAKTGKDTFDYSADAHRSGVLRPHQTLDPQGLERRESRDSEEHPTSNAIIISLDVTGSMGRVVRGIHGDLPHLHELLLGHNYIPHPQILFMAVGDATCDRVPLQVGQFESDNRMDQHLENMILEGGGGGQKTESYELAMYIAAHHTSIDCWEKRKHKGYLFMIGDEMAYPAVSKQEVNRLIGPEMQSDEPLEQVIARAKEMYNLYFIVPGGASHGADKNILAFWQSHLGPQNVLKLENPEDTSECIALTIGMNEGAISLNDGINHLRKRGLVSHVVDRVSSALSWLMPASSATSADPSRSRHL
jgi:hypothetical protein